MKRKLLVLSLLAVLAVAINLFGPAAAPVQASPKTEVNLSGIVTNSALGLTLHVQASALGLPTDLSGQGSDNFRSGGRHGYCLIPLSGSLSGSVVTLSGTVVFSNDPANLGVPVTFIADASTGAITFDFGGFIFTGTGVVQIANP